MSGDFEGLGEFDLIDRLVARLPAGGLPVGPGDDAAVISEQGGTAMLAAADLLLEGQHFDLTLSSFADVGFKAIAVNVSDMAAMGARPLAALISLGCSPAGGAQPMEELYDGVADAARRFGVAIAGGDVVRSERLIISVAIVGEATRPVLRRGGVAGDVLCVTGRLGAAAAGLALLRAAPNDADARTLLDRFPGLAEAHRRGRARVAEGIAAARAGAHAMIDVSDGLGQDVGHICAASACAARIDAGSLPLAEGVKEVATWLGRVPREIALAGGDDYELAIALAPEHVAAARDAISPTPLTEIGRLMEGEGVVLDDGTIVSSAGWDPFR